MASSAMCTISIAAFREASPTKPHHRPPTHRPIRSATSSASRTPTSEAGARPKAVPTCRWCDVEHGDGPTQRVEWAEYADTEAKASPKGRWRGVCARVVVSYGPTCARNLVLQRKGDAAFVEGFNRRTTIARRRCIKFLRERRKRMENVFKADDITVERCFLRGPAARGQDSPAAGARCTRAQGQQGFVQEAVGGAPGILHARG